MAVDLSKITWGRTNHALSSEMEELSARHYFDCESALGALPKVTGWGDYLE